MQKLSNIASLFTSSPPLTHVYKLISAPPQSVPKSNFLTTSSGCHDVLAPYEA
jgi:hypothetical protein